MNNLPCALHSYCCLTMRQTGCRPRASRPLVEIVRSFVYSQRRIATTTCLLICCCLFLHRPAYAFIDCDWFNLVPKEGTRSDPLSDSYWISVGPSRLDPDSRNDTSRLAPVEASKSWTHCGPMEPDVVSQ